MQSNTSSQPEQPPSLADAAVILCDLKAAAQAAHDAQVALVDAVDAADRCGAVITREGLPLDLLLAVDHHHTGSQRWQLLTAAKVLRTLPTVSLLWRQRQLSWGQVGDIVAKARSLRVEQRATLDARIAASVDDLDKLDPDQLRWAVTEAVDDLRGARAKQRTEAAQADDVFCSAQQDFDGGGRLYTGLDPVSMAAALDVLATYAHPLTANTAGAGGPTTRAKPPGRGLVDRLRATDANHDAEPPGAGGAANTDATDGPPTPARRRGHPRLGRPLI